MTEPDPSPDPWFIVVSRPVGRLIGLVTVGVVADRAVHNVLAWIWDVFFARD